MKPLSHHKHGRGTLQRGSQAFTLPEMMVTVAVFMLMMAGLIYCYIFGLRIDQVTKIKLGASDDARSAIAHMTDEIRSATYIKIGSGTLNSFTEVVTNALQAGNAIEIHPDGTDTNWIRYYYETNMNSSNYTMLLRTTDGVSATNVIAHRISANVPIFSSEDSWGRTLTNNENNRVIGMTLQFYQIEYPVVKIGPSNYYDFYQLHTRITRRRLY
jgi:type II secretory pathway pseudopilin PulG